MDEKRASNTFFLTEIVSATRRWLTGVKLTLDPSNELALQDSCATTWSTDSDVWKTGEMLREEEELEVRMLKSSPNSDRHSDTFGKQRR